VREGRIWVDGAPYDSPSAAARAAHGTENAVNGWWTWSFWDEATETWKPLNVLRGPSALPPVPASNLAASSDGAEQG
jgi:hypothetical protein